MYYTFARKNHKINLARFPIKCHQCMVCAAAGDAGAALPCSTHTYPDVYTVCTILRQRTHLNIYIIFLFLYYIRVCVCLCVYREFPMFARHYKLKSQLATSFNSHAPCYSCTFIYPIHSLPHLSPIRLFVHLFQYRKLEKREIGGFGGSLPT